MCFYTFSEFPFFFSFLNSSGEDFNIYVLKLCRSPKKKHSIFNPLLSVSLKTLCFTLFVILSNPGEASVKSVPIVTSQKADFLNLCIDWHTLAGSGFRRMDYKVPPLHTRKDNAIEHSGKVSFALGLVVLLPSGVNYIFCLNQY